MLPLNFCLNILQDLYQQAKWNPDRCVRLLDFENDMRFENPDEFDEIERACGFSYFMYYCLETEYVFNAFYGRFACCFVLVEAEDYYRNGFDGHECNEYRFTDPLFLLIDHNKFDSHEHKAKKAASLRLESELFKFYQDNAMTPKTVRDRNTVINKINAMIRDAWPNLSFRVNYFGSTRTHLASDDSDLDLAIVVPQVVNTGRENMKNLRRLQNSVFNMHTLADELQRIGMIDIVAIQNASVPICKFTDPETNLHCDINASSSLGMENSQLIDDYRKLDKRVGPFLYALKYFVKKRDINDNQGGTLSSYAYCLLGIYYLMNHNYGCPIIPNLHELRGASDVCDGKNCKFGKTRYYVENQQVRYHDCVEVVSESEYQMPKEPAQRGFAKTQWDGYCHDNLGEVMLAFFKWASKLENLTTHMSIRHAPNKVPNPPRKWFKKSMVVQDPFIQNKNVAQSCSELGLNRIQFEFERAAKLLEETDMNFVDMCNSKTDPPLNDSFSAAAAAAVFQIPIKIKLKNNKSQNRFRHGIQNGNQSFNAASNHRRNDKFIDVLGAL